MRWLLLNNLAPDQQDPLLKHGKFPLSKTRDYSPVQIREREQKINKTNKRTEKVCSFANGRGLERKMSNYLPSIYSMSAEVRTALALNG